MAIAKTETLLPLDTFAAILGVHPLHFNQIQIEGGCGKVYLQYDWQGPNAVSRESVALAIKSAEDDLEQYLGFPTAPKWYDDILLTAVGSPVVLPKAHYITGGKQAKSLVQADATITYSDNDDDGFSETATVQVAYTGIASELAVFYPGELDQIRPIKVSVDSGIATITLNRYDCVLRVELEKLHPSAIVGTDDDKFLTSVDIYRIYNDSSVQALLRSCNSCGGSGCAICEFSEESACLLGINYKDSIVAVQPSTYSDGKYTASQCVGNIYAGRFWFKAGWTGDSIWDQAVAYLAISRLAEVGVCDCPTVQRRLDYWITDMSRSDRVANYKVPEYMKYCPWGWSRGAMFAYSIAIKHRMPQGLK